ncbi:hypothetical protein QZH41_017409 [Actinostola sp. cb2023]|nr:hypothetical protein QZH41_017409 [Actinostola sp. cb2023]
MGVPKFYRWVSERYPCLSQVVQEHQIPEFDNMYLDMNGIIHPCSHPNDDDPHFRITEEQIFRNIFHYIEILFQIIKPKKVFFMAVDGVAPRAKMNQQRGRRFRSAKDAEDNIRRAIEKGQVLPKEERFDSNCITPGTGFMTRLQEQLKYFVNEKISNDPAWRGLKVYLSGHQTPGEGEHKIMEFIRTEKSKPDYDPNTRHCLYGLDADLMMLGLSSHEPHFSLLREEVRFGKTSKRIEKPENITFHLLHLSLFREYLDWEFYALKDSLSFPYDLERIIDDWILMGFLVGNDFIPHLPHLHINHNALPMLYRVYTQVLPTLDGYLHDGGVLNLGRFEKYLIALSKLDREKFDEIFVDMKWFEAKTKHGFDKKPGKPRKKGDRKKDSEANPFAALDSLSDKLDQTKLDDEEKMSPELAKLAAALDDDDEDRKEITQDDVFEIEFAMYKKQYYREKFEIENISSDQLSRFVWEYVRGIQWILHYYFNGVQSWGWFYPYHYAPFLSDLTEFGDYELEYDMGNPFLPFEQLLSVLPAASKQLLPLPLQNLMIMEESPIIEYYPLTFKTDLNGKQQEWEAVVLIPFLDQKRLLDAMKPLYPRLTKEETKRNSHGPFLVYDFENELSFTYPSSLPGSFPDIVLCQARCQEFDRQELVTPREKLTKGLCEAVRLEVYFPGFPTLHHIHHHRKFSLVAELKKANVKVFQMHSRWESIVLKLTPHTQKDTHRIAEDLLEELCYVGWPHLVEAKVTSVSDNTFRSGEYTVPRDKPKTEDGNKNIDQTVLTEQSLVIFHKQVSSYTQSQLERRGIEVGDIDILIEACPIQGRRFICGAKGQVSLEKEWSTVPKPYAFQSIAKDIFVHESQSENTIQSIEQLFPINSPCFILAAPHYGAQGEVLEVDVNQGRVRVQLNVPTEPSFGSIMMQKESLSDAYIPAHILAQKLGLSNSLLGKITAKFLIERGSRERSKGQGQSKLDIGLNMKHSKHNKELLGYVKRTEQGSWLFSQAAQKIIMEYTRKFPRLFDTVAVLESQLDQIYESDLLTRKVDLQITLVIFYLIAMPSSNYFDRVINVKLNSAVPLV